MKTLITVLASALSFGSVNASTSADIPFVKFESAQEELINPFDNGFRIESPGDTIRRDRAITESDIESTSEDIHEIISQDIKITEAVLPAYQPLDWGMIVRSQKIVKPVVHINRNL